MNKGTHTVNENKLEEEEDRWKYKRVNLLFHLPLSLSVHLRNSGKLVAVPVSQRYAFPLDSVTADCLCYTAEVYPSQTLVDLFQTSMHHSHRSSQRLRVCDLTSCPIRSCFSFTYMDLQ